MTLKEVPPGYSSPDKIKSIKKRNLKNLDKVAEGLKDGSIRDAIVVYRQDGEDYFLPLTDSTYETFGWVMQKAIIAMSVENGGSGEE